MKNRILLLIIFYPLISLSQETFQKMNWNVYGSTVGVFALPDSCSLIFTSSSTGSSFLILKVDKNGNHIWAKLDSSSRYENRFHDPHVIATNDGHFVVAGTRMENNYYKNASIIKMDSSGTVLWNKTYTNIQFLSSINETNDSGFIISGQNNDTIISGTHYDKIILRTDSIGNIKWNKLLQRDSIFIWPNNNYDIIETDDGGYLYQNVHASWKLDSAGNPLRSNWILNRNNTSDKHQLLKINPNVYVSIQGSYITCLDSTGTVKWSHVDGDYNYQHAARLNDGEFLILGDEHQIWRGAFLEMLDTGGVRAEHIFYQINAQVYPEKMISYENGSVFISGRADPWQIQTYNLIVMKTDSNRIIGCGENTYPPPPYIPLIDSIAPFLFGTTVQSMSIITDTLTSNIYPVWLEDTICYQLTALPEVNAAKVQIEIFPNPSISTITIKPSKPLPDDMVSIIIYNSTGAIQFHSSQTLLPKTIDTKNIQAGVYFVKLTSEKWNSVHKLAIVRN